MYCRQVFTEACSGVTSHQSREMVANEFENLEFVVQLVRIVMK